MSRDIVFESRPGTQSFRIEFTTRDARAVNYDLFFYDRSADEIAYCSIRFALVQ